MRLIVAALWLAVAMQTFGIVHAQGSPDAGRNNFLKFCASCHGKSGRGDGPMVAHLVRAPTDLTLLAESHGGVFPSLRVLNSIDGRGSPRTDAHGPREMPVWGSVLRTPAPAGPARPGNPERDARRQMADLLEYLARIQEK